MPQLAGFLELEVICKPANGCSIALGQKLTLAAPRATLGIHFRVENEG